MQPIRYFPDTKLFIYYLEGRIAKETAIVNKNHIGTWFEDGFSFLFFLAPAEDDISHLVASSPQLTLIDNYEMTYEQWQGGRIEPLQIGSFLLVPPWFKPPADEPSTVLILDPGVVFGNGLHPTTRACIQAIDIACSGGKVATALDLGTGTGVLAMAAARRGCKKVFAVDNNLLACQTAAMNMDLNGLQNKVLVVNAKAETFNNSSTDLLIANIHYDIMKEIVTSPGLLNQKWFILSGLLKSEAAKIEELFSTLQVLLLHRWCSDDIWVTFLGITRH